MATAVSMTGQVDEVATATLSRPGAVWILTLCALPVVTTLFSFSPAGDFATWQMVARQFWLPTQIFEIVTVVYAISIGLSLHKQILAFGKPIVVLAAIWLASLLLATGLAEYKSEAILSMMSWLLHASFAIAVVFLFQRWRHSGQNDVAETFAHVMPLGVAAYILSIATFMTFVGTNANYDWVSSLPGFPHIRHPAYFLMPAMALSTALIATTTGRSRLCHIALLALIFGFAIWIGSRGPLMAYFAMLIVSLILFKAMRTRPTLAAITLAIAAASIGSQAVPAPDHHAFNVIDRLRGIKTGSAEELSSGRTIFWQQTLQGISEQPLVGHGGSNFRLQVPVAVKNYNHPHNSVLQFAYDWGIFGAGAMLLMLGFVAIKVTRLTLHNPGRNLPLFLAASSMAIFSLMDGLYYYNLPIILFVVCCAGVLTQGSASNATTE